MRAFPDVTAHACGAPLKAALSDADARKRDSVDALLDNLCILTYVFLPVQACVDYNGWRV